MRLVPGPCAELLLTDPLARSLFSSDPYPREIFTNPLS